MSELQELYNVHVMRKSPYNIPMGVNDDT
jgi:hypothetical protein